MAFAAGADGGGGVVDYGVEEGVVGWLGLGGVAGGGGEGSGSRFFGEAVALWTWLFWISYIFAT